MTRAARSSHRPGEGDPGHFSYQAGEFVSGGGVADVAGWTATDEDGELVVTPVAPTT